MLDAYIRSNARLEPWRPSQDSLHAASLGILDSDGEPSLLLHGLGDEFALADAPKVPERLSKTFSKGSHTYVCLMMGTFLPFVVPDV